MASRVVPCLALAATVCLAMPAAGEPVNPYPRELVSTQTLAAWSFDSGDEGWKAAHDCTVRAEGGRLVITSTGEDPYLAGPALSAKGPVAVRLTMRSRAGGGGQIFWATAESPNFDEAKSAHFAITADGKDHEYTVPLEVAGTLVRLRLDPGSTAGEVAVDGMTLIQMRWHPLEIRQVEQKGAEVHLDLQNREAEAIAFALAGARHTLPGGETLHLALPAAGTRPFEAFPIVIEPQGLPPVRRTIFLVRPDAPGDWVVREGEGLVLRVARDGSGARLEAGGTLVAVIAPLVHRGGEVPALAQPEQAKGNGDVRLEGKGLRVRLRVGAGEVAVAIESQEAVEGPVVRALGNLEGGIFAGLEYLGKGEASSSDLDIETDERFRYAPDLRKVTMPLMTCATDRGTVAVTWKDMANQPVYATPNFFDGAADHRMALRGKKIEATVRVGREPIEETILWAVNRSGGLPLPPAPPRTAEEQWRLCLAAIRGPISGEGGWGHCAEASWKRQPYADIASTLWRLTGEAPDLPRLVPGGGHLPNEAIYFVTGRADEWLRMRAGQVKGVLGEQQADGSFRYAGPYRRGHYEDTASGHCASRAAILLDWARATGDAAALEGGLRTLEYMKRFQVPRGAQTWELSLHTPDILASAYLVRAYVAGYELTGKAEYLACARRWALSGVPFVYLWGDRPIMLYATIPVFGATNWRAPNWMGLPVQWCGGVYAYALHRLAPHDRTLDWDRLARGILVAGEQMQCPDGPTAGCLPDSLALADQRRNGPMINPSALVGLRLVLDGKLDALAVARDGKRRVVAPFPATIRGETAVVQAAKGVAYQVVVDGKRVVDVKSAGTDEVPLGPAE